MKDTQKIVDEIKGFVIKERGKYRFELNENHSLQSDLKIYGLDAVDFILNFGKRFGVDVSNFDAEKYFKPDGFSVKKDYPELTIGDLINSIEKGVLL